MPSVAAALMLVLAEVTGWDKTGAISGVIAAVTGTLILVGTAYVSVRNWWPQFRRRHTFTFDAPESVEVGRHLGLWCTLYVHRDSFLVDVGCHFRFKKDPGTNPGDGTVQAWFDKKPARGPLKRGQAIPLVLNVEAKSPWRGFLCIEISDGSGYSCSSIAPFEVTQAAI